MTRPANRARGEAALTIGGERLLLRPAAWVAADYRWMRWTGSEWSAGTLPAAALVIDGVQVVGPRLPQVSSPSGGTIIDVEARAAIAALIATLKSHGLTD